jgi:4-hydroxybenzoate polyprenyltransferase
MLTLVRSLLELIRFSHTIFALPFALLSACLAWADDRFRWLDLLGILFGMVLARSAAMAFNRLVDRHIDARNPRTASRHLPAGKLSVPLVLAFTIFTSIAFVASTMLFLFREPANPWPLFLAVPILLFVLGYSLAKRFTSLAHFWLGAALMLAPIAAWIAIRGVDLEHLNDFRVPCLIALAVAFWVSGFDIFYACQDFAFDRDAKLHSVPVRFGIARSLRIAAACHAVMFAILVALGFVAERLGAIYFCGLVPVGLLLAYEHWLVRPDDLSRVNKAFFQVNGIISFGLFALVAVQLVVGK